MATEKDRSKIKGDPMPNLPPALGLCLRCANRKPVRTKLHLVRYCEHNQAGGYFDESTGYWSIVSPVSLKDFALALGATEVLIAQRSVGERIIA